MFRLLEFLRSTYLVIIFVIAEGIAINYYASSNSYTRGKMLTVSHSLMRGVQKGIHNGSRLFELSSENEALTRHIGELTSYIQMLEQLHEERLSSDEIVFENPECSYVVARVVSNSINKHDNFIVIDRGVEDGVRENMALITPTGEMLGYIVGCTSRYSAALSVLSHSFTTSGKLLHGEHFGSISWSGESRYSLSMSDLSKYALINQGDTLVSTGFSQIFPSGVTIGTVGSFSFNEMKTAYNVEVELSADLSTIDHVLVVGRYDSEAVNELMEIIK